MASENPPKDYEEAVRGESVIFDKENNAKLVGLCYSKIYFNPDTETFFKLVKVDHKREFLPAEVFSDEFDPIPADVYSFVYLLYAAISDLKKKHRTRRIGHLDYANLNNESTAKALVELLTSHDPVKRLKLSQIKSQSYFTEQQE